MRVIDYNWDCLFFNLAFSSAMRSKDPSTKCGACIVRDNKSIGLGYNGLPLGFVDNESIWEKEVKKDYVIHAEMNAIANSNTIKFDDSEIYIWTSNKQITLPCSSCMKHLVQFNIKKIHVLDHQIDVPDELKLRWGLDISIKIANTAKISIIKHDALEINSKILEAAKKNIII